jgi:hypothetical protein
MFFGTLDEVLTYLFKSALRTCRYYKSSSWEQTTAQVTGQIVLLPIWGCASLRLHYKFDLEGDLIKSSDVIPFRFRLDAKTYAQNLTHNVTRVIRVNPRNPQETRFFERDQKGRVAHT